MRSAGSGWSWVTLQRPPPEIRTLESGLPLSRMVTRAEGSLSAQAIAPKKPAAPPPTTTTRCPSARIGQWYFASAVAQLQLEVLWVVAELAAEEVHPTDV